MLRFDMARLTALYLLLAACGGGGGFPDAPEPDARPSGKFSVDWSVIDSNSSPLSCDRIAAQSMTVLMHNREFEGGSTEAFGCNTGSGTSQSVIAGTYDMDFELSGTFGVLQRAPSQHSIEIVPNTTTRLAALTFQIDATGALALTLASGKQGGNCEPVNQNPPGAGIDTMSITLNHASDSTACEPITLNIAAGTTRPATVYTINCTTPVDAPCIEADQTISAAGVPSDAYTIRVRGKIANKVCWSNDDSIQLPPLGKVLMRTLNLGYQSTTTGC